MLSKNDFLQINTCNGLQLLRLPFGKAIVQRFGGVWSRALVSSIAIAWADFSALESLGLVVDLHRQESKKKDSNHNGKKDKEW